MLSLLSFICRPLKFLLRKLLWPISLLTWHRKSHDQNLPVQNPEPIIPYTPSLRQNLLIPLPANDSSIKKPPLQVKRAPAPAPAPVKDPQPRLPDKNTCVVAKAILAPVKDPQPRLPDKNTCVFAPVRDTLPRLPDKNTCVFAKEIRAHVKTWPLDDPQPPLSLKNAVTSPQAKSGHPDQVTVNVPKFTASLAYTSACADKAIQHSSALPKKDSSKSKPKKGTEKVKEAVVVIKSSVAVHEGRWIKYYSSRHRILLVGDGDFSFSACLATAFGCASNMIATSLDSKEFLTKNYNRAESNLNELKKRQCKVLHGIDATKMATHELLGQRTFDRIIFNFPFAGFFKTLARKTQLRRHRRLVSRFLKNAREMVSENGEIHISHKINGFHVEWNLENVASSHRLRLIEAVQFNLEDYPGYNTKRGFGGNDNFDCNPSKTYKFGIKWVLS